MVGPEGGGGGGVGTGVGSGGGTGVGAGGGVGGAGVGESEHLSEQTCTQIEKTDAEFVGHAAIQFCKLPPGQVLALSS